MVKNVLKKNEKRRKNNKGFSLVELIVVIAIMAVLVGVLAPQLIKYVEKSREATDIQNCDSIATALKSYYADDENNTKAEVTIPTSGNISGDTEALTDAGLDNTKLKGTKWYSAIKITYEDGKITYTCSGSPYYKVDNNGNFVKGAGTKPTTPAEN